MAQSFFEVMSLKNGIFSAKKLYVIIIVLSLSQNTVSKKWGRVKNKRTRSPPKAGKLEKKNERGGGRRQFFPKHCRKVIALKEQLNPEAKATTTVSYIQMVKTVLL